MTTIVRSIAAVALAAVAPLAWADEFLTLDASQARALGIETQAVGTPVSRAGTSLPARVLVPTEQMRVVAAPVGGLVEMLAAAPGTAVRKGQPLAQLASPQGLELQRDALQAGSQSGLLQENLKRDEILFAEGLIPESRLRATGAAAAQAAAQAEERRRELKLAGIPSGRLGSSLTLTAPIDGVVLEQGVQLGQRVEAAAMIYRIARLAPLWLEIQAPLDVAAGLRPGTPVKVLNSDVAGKLIAVGRAVDPASQTVLLRAAVDKGAESLTVGQMVEVELAPGHPQGQPIPSQALVRREGRTFAFVQTDADKGLRFEVRPVRVLGQGGSSVQAEGLRPGERIVIKGTSGLKAMLVGVGRD